MFPKYIVKMCQNANYQILNNYYALDIEQSFSTHLSDVWNTLLFRIMSYMFGRCDYHETRKMALLGKCVSVLILDELLIAIRLDHAIFSPTWSIRNTSLM